MLFFRNLNYLRIPETVHLNFFLTTKYLHENKRVSSAADLLLAGHAIAKTHGERSSRRAVRLFAESSANGAEDCVCKPPAVSGDGTRTGRNFLEDV